MPIGRDVDAAITRFHVETGGTDRWHVVVGNMHVVCSTNPPPIPARQRALRRLRDHLDGYVFEDAGIPVVRIIVGDSNLLSKDVGEALQRETEAHPLWEVYPSPADGWGDHVAVTGAAARFQSIAVGASFEDRGMRPDSHDAVAVDITLPDASTPPEAKKRRMDFPESDPEVVGWVVLGGDEADNDQATDEEAPIGDDDEGPEARCRAEQVHAEVRHAWGQRYGDRPYSPAVLRQLHQLLFMKRKSAEAAEEHPGGAPQSGSESGRAFASQAETARAIRSVLQLRQSFLQRKNITNMRHVLSDEERQELVRAARDTYQASVEQLELQERDREKAREKGKT